jgi:hypothetical protein
MNYLIFLTVCVAIPVVMMAAAYAAVYLGEKSFD